ncbi:alcohol dehydrogenase catalytic domain-containing protein [Cryptosporangium japonicum]|uniref:Zinc-binding dehydrogenase n=1 Tax=Cryptosporangium japonicum TaxID=80872 RepID=A0ABP3DE79_9ACTN
MRALQQHSFRGPRDLRLVTDVPVPTPGPGEVLIRVTAAGVNLADVTQTYGRYGGGPQPPYLAGFEGAGEIVALGPGTTGFTVGDHVIGTGYGAFAEYQVLSDATPVPPGWDDEQALGLMLNWGTAVAALKPLGRLAAGETVLIPAAAGGVGQAAVRAAVHYGATVLATASPAKHDVVRALGAEIVDVRDQRDVDLVLESIGGDTFAASLAAARPFTGRVVVYGLASGEAAVTNHQLVFDHPVQVVGLHIGRLRTDAPDLFAAVVSELETLRAAGVLTPGTPTVHDLADGPEALQRLETRRTIGKLALKP